MNRGFGGFGGGGGGANIQAMMRQAQQMQQQMQKQKDALEATTFDSTSGGGMVSIQMNGAYELTDIKIKPEVVDADDVEMLEDLIIAAVNDVTKKVKKANDAITGGIM
ncbi:MAG: YbaB/EbfC family nucleoid-associated protein [Firmicutes bacterium]|nr:YbaB/EbfC family nucleoid-associated protein [Bacillota bacterium]